MGVSGRFATRVYRGGAERAKALRTGVRWWQQHVWVCVFVEAIQVGLVSDQRGRGASQATVLAKM